MVQEVKHHNRQIATVLGLTGIAVIHILDLPGKFAEAPYLAFGYIGIIVVAGILIERLLTGMRTVDYLISSVLSVAVLIGFVINRTVGMPGATGDIGNWLEPLGFLSLFVEIWAVWQSITGYQALKALKEQSSLSR
jgi:vacuolar-type H+-ATPase subunit I/STV1